MRILVRPLLAFEMQGNITTKGGRIMLDLQRGLRGLAILTLTLAVASCGGGGNDNTSDDGSPPAGTFVGTLTIGGAITLQVGGIEEIAFECAGVSIQETFSPPQPIAADRSFHVEFSDGGRKFDVEGTFSDDDHVSGTIADHDHHCDSPFEATRSTGTKTPTPVITPTPTGPTTETPTGEATVTPTDTGETPTATPTSTSSGPTSTTGTPTMTPTPTPTTTPTGPICPVAVEVVSTAGNQKVLDTGYTGIAHNQTVIQDGKLTLALSGCAGSPPHCGQCTTGGPIQNVNADHGDINPHRCTGDTSIKCSTNTDCGSSGTCAFYFGAPLPLSAGGVSTCVTNQVNGPVTGTANVETGDFASTLNLTSRIFLNPDIAHPCPRCVGDTTVNDGVKGGTCSDGPKAGAACDGNGRSTLESFGTTSFDCPPAGFISALSIALDGSSGTEKMTLGASSPVCAGIKSKKCFCANDNNVPSYPNSCVDDTATPTIHGCQPLGGSPTKGECPSSNNVDQNCVIDTFQGCQADSDCPAAGDHCGSQQRPCYLDNGAVGGSVTAIGMADPPDANGESDPTFAALFCVGSVAQSSINTTAGLPGLGRIQLPLHSKLLSTIP
jgi:hypothetical protein